MSAAGGAGGEPGLGRRPRPPAAPPRSACRAPSGRAPIALRRQPRPAAPTPPRSARSKSTTPPARPPDPRLGLPRRPADRTPSTPSSPSTSRRRPPDGDRVKLAGQGHARPADRPAHHHLRRQPPAPLRRLQASTSSKAPGRRCAPRPPAAPTTTTAALDPLDRPRQGADSAHHSDSFAITAGPGRAPAPSGALGPEAHRRPRQPHRRHLQPLLVRGSPAPTASGNSPPSRLPAPGLGRQARRRPLLPRGRDRRGRRALRRRPRRPEAAIALLPGRLPGRHRHRRRRRRPHPLLHPRQGLPRRPLQRRPALPRGRSPRPSPAPSTSAPSSSAPPSTSTPKPPRSRRSATRCRQILDGIPLDLRDIRVDIDRPELHPQPDQLRRQGRSAPTVTGRLRRRPPAPRNRFQVGGCARPGLQARSVSLKLKGGTKRSAPPGPAARSSPTPRARTTPTSPPPRSPCRTRSSSTRPTSDDLHPGPVRRQQPARRARSTATPRRSRRSSTSPWKARSTCAPPPTRCPTWSPP